MREAVGSAFLVNLILIFIGVISALVIGSISYSKAYKVKDRIVYVIEKYDGFTDAAETELDTSLRNLGYSIRSGQNTGASNCETIYRRKTGSKYDSSKLLHGNSVNSEYNYCVYKYDYDTSIGVYYGVTSFMRFDIPLLGGLLTFSVNGETSLIYDVIDN